MIRVEHKTLVQITVTSELQNALQEEKKKKKANLSATCVYPATCSLPVHRFKLASLPRRAPLVLDETRVSDPREQGLFSGLKL